MNKKLSFAAILLTSAAGMSVFSSNASATGLSATDILNDYNLVVFGNLTSTSDVDGKTFAGGNVSGGNYAGHYSSLPVNTAISSLTVGGNLSGSVNLNGPGLTVGNNLSTTNFNSAGGNVYVGGSVTSSANFNENGSGNVYVHGTVVGGVNVNGGTLHTGVATASLPDVSSTLTSYQNELAAYSAQLGALTENSTYTLSNGTATFNATPGANGVAVFDITDAQTFFAAAKQFSFSLNGAKEVIIDVSGAGANQLDIDGNFLNGQAQSLGTDTVWNFTDAKNIDVQAQFGGALLATEANLTTSGNIEGTVIADSITQNAEIHYDGQQLHLPSAVPLPGALSLFGSALAGVGFIARRGIPKT